MRVELPSTRSNRTPDPGRCPPDPMRHPYSRPRPLVLFAAPVAAKRRRLAAQDFKAADAEMVRISITPTTPETNSSGATPALQ